MHIIDIIVFLLFTGGVVAFGCSFFKKKGTSEEFTSAGRSLPGWVVGMSIFATYVSSISYLGYPGKAFSGDWNAFVFSLSIPIASYLRLVTLCLFTGVRTAYRLIAFWKTVSVLGHVYMLRPAICSPR